jgi:tetratricopeptide (TPR) repeat protein
MSTLAALSRAMAEEGNQSKSEKRRGRWIRVLLVYVIGLGLVLMIPGYFVHHYFTYSTYVFEVNYERFDNYEVKFVNASGDSLARPDFGPQKTAWTAYQSYEQGNFETAIPQLKALLNIYPENSNAYLYIGLCHLELRQCPQAIAAFQAVIDQKNMHYKAVAEWYLVLAYLLEGDENEYHSRLHAISISKSDYRLKAKEVLDVLD